MSHRWVILTAEYPPEPGGVSDYTRAVARGLADAGEDVHVWAPPAAGEPSRDEGVSVHTLNGFGPRDLSKLAAWLDAGPPARLFVQYVPHAFGLRAMNVPFCLWLAARARRDEVWTMYHEVAYPIERGARLRHNFLGIVNRLMAMIVTRASRRVFITIPAWADILRPLGRRGQEFEWMPVPSTVSTRIPSPAVSAARAALGWNGTVQVIGHFGTYPRLIRDVLRDVLPELLKAPSRCALLLGRGSRDFMAQMLAKHPELSDRIRATGGLPAEEAAIHMAACDVLLQPYPDGVSCRRTTTMAALALGVPLVTNLGHLSESIWADSRAVALASDPSSSAVLRRAGQLLDDTSAWRDLAERGKRLYDQRFSVERTIEILRRDTQRVGRPVCTNEARQP